MSKEFEKYCSEEYVRIYKEEYKKADGTGEEKARTAQKKAINAVALSAMKKYPDVSIDDLWKAIKMSHIVNKSSFNLETITIVESATQSWKSASGKAFEDFITALISAELSEQSIIAVVQKDMKVLIDDEMILNDYDDIEWFSNCIKHDIYDCYVLHKESDKYMCFGVMQCKTTLRDRVMRDREPSIDAMDKHHLWSTIFVFDSEYLIGKRGPTKFELMVEGGGQYDGVGFHSLYSFSEESGVGQYKGREKSRLFFENISLDCFKKHAVLAYKMYSKQRHKMNRDWHPDDPVTYRE